MKLSELFEVASESTLEPLTAKRQEAQANLSDITKRGRHSGAGPVAPQYMAQYNRAKLAVDQATEAIAQYHATKSAPEEQRVAAKYQAEKKAAETPEEKKKRFGRAVGDGLNTGYALRDEHGGWEGLAKHVLAIVRKAKNDSDEKISAEYIADHLGTTPRTVNRWLESEGNYKPFLAVARLLGRK